MRLKFRTHPENFLRKQVGMEWCHWCVPSQEIDKQNVPKLKFRTKGQLFRTPREIAQKPPKLKSPFIAGRNTHFQSQQLFESWRYEISSYQQIKRKCVKFPKINYRPSLKTLSAWRIITLVTFCHIVSRPPKYIFQFLIDVSHSLIAFCITGA